jgi:hypothetical protein
LTDDEIGSFHLRFDSRLYGDEMFLLEPGTAIFPNFHSYIKPKAMHAYDPADPDQLGILVAPARVGPAPATALEMVDVVPIVVSLLGLPEEAPPAPVMSRLVHAR